MSEPNRQNLPRFPILKLPFLAMKNAVVQMEVLDIYKLSKSSEVCKKLVKLMNMRTEGIDVFVTGKWSNIEVIPTPIDYDDDVEDDVEDDDDDTTTETTPVQYFFSKEEDIFPDAETLSPKEIHLVPDHVVGCLDMAKHMNQLFEMKERRYHFILPIKSTEETINLLSGVLEKKCTGITIMGGSVKRDQNQKFLKKVVDKRILDCLMDKLSLDAEINIGHSLPDNYNHENLFKFRCFTNENASFVTIELLKTLRNVKSLFLFNTNLNSKDLNEFISYFINCEEDMMEEIKITIKHENTFRVAEVLDQLTTLPYDFGSGPDYLIKVRHPKNRKCTLIQFSILDYIKGIHLATIEDVEEYTVQLEILDLMEKAKDLEKELVEIEEHEKQVNDQETLKELIERKKAIQVELAEIQTKLFLLQN